METLRGLRDRKKAATRCALGAAALRLAGEVGLDRATAEAIAAAANVSTRTFHNYFGRKEDAILFHLDRIQDRWTEILRQRPADENVWDSIEQTALTMVDQHPGDIDDLVTIIALSSAHPQLAALHLTAGRRVRPVERAITERLPADDTFTPRLIEHVAVITIHAALAAAGDDAHDRRTHLIQGFSLLRKGFGALPERESTPDGDRSSIGTAG